MFYEFKCEYCGNKTTVERPMKNASDEEMCAKCGKIMSRIWNPAPVHFKGWFPGAAHKKDPRY